MMAQGMAFGQIADAAAAKLRERRGKESDSMTQEEYLKELKELYEHAKNKGKEEAAFCILTAIKSSSNWLPDDPCGVEEFRKQADQQSSAVDSMDQK